MISVIKIGNLYIGLVGAVLDIMGLVHRFIIYIAGWASVVDVFLIMYVNGKQLGELIHGVGSLGKCASRPFRQPPYVRGGRQLYSVLLNFPSRFTYNKMF